MKSIKFKSSYANDASRNGQLAAPKQLFGDCSRYAVAPVHTRFDAVQWFVWDAEVMCSETGLPEVIRMEPTLAQAIENISHGTDGRDNDGDPMY
jgi:hypothetical protein